ncbi:MAG: DUF1285 domain-containing protein [Deltaproteobacteria bacterium]|nr:DUF1285 domain-containing protein [Deltaproteobacteria bacterium]
MTERIYHYTIDEEGTVWHDGAEVDDPAVLKLFFKNLKPTDDGRFVALCQGETCYFKAVDVPMVVQKIEIKKEREKIKEILLFFPGEVSEPLDAESLFVGKKNVLYCRIRNGSLVARFNRKSYWELAQEIRQDKESHLFFLEIKGRKQTIPTVS